MTTDEFLEKWCHGTDWRGRELWRFVAKKPKTVKATGWTYVTASPAQNDGLPLRETVDLALQQLHSDPEKIAVAAEYGESAKVPTLYFVATKSYAVPISALDDTEALMRLCHRHGTVVIPRPSRFSATAAARYQGVIRTSPISDIRSSQHKVCRYQVNRYVYDNVLMLMLTSGRCLRGRKLEQLRRQQHTAFAKDLEKAYLQVRFSFPLAGERLTEIALPAIKKVRPDFVSPTCDFRCFVRLLSAALADDPPEESMAEHLRMRLLSTPSAVTGICKRLRTILAICEDALLLAFNMANRFRILGDKYTCNYLHECRRLCVEILPQLEAFIDRYAGGTHE